MIDKDFIQEVIERASEEGVSYNHKFECVYKLIQNFILVHDMENNNEGQALLYAVEKTAERTKREMIEKATQFIYDTIFGWTGGSVTKTWKQCRDEYVGRLKQSMQYDTSQRL